MPQRHLRLLLVSAQCANGCPASQFLDSLVLLAQVAAQMTVFVCSAHAGAAMWLPFLLLCCSEFQSQVAVLGLPLQLSPEEVSLAAAAGAQQLEEPG